MQDLRKVIRQRNDRYSSPFKLSINKKATCLNRGSSRWLVLRPSF
ncbi:hypothetical protein NEOC65_001973 [Neochlamydia sp. AcF65]|nr:hypothetical protein [Neochlamydia sp. AcF65]